MNIGESEALKGIWPEEAHQAAVSLTFDDGGATQLSRAIPEMEKRGLRGTFYLCPRGDDHAERLAPWKEIAARGHEIGNHSLSHTCSNNLKSYPPTRGLENMTIEEIEEDILEAEKRLRELFPETTERSFCYPCYQNHIGQGLTRQSYVPIVAKHFVAGRGSGEYGLPNHPLNCDLHYLVSQPGERMSGCELVGLTERAARKVRWIVFTFHSIDGGRLGINEFEFCDLLDHLAAHKDRLWTAPVVEVAKQLVKARAERQA
ncbi:MAG: polysaccharide deacetylase family protein [Planctomycetes bacterium]|nr:polysaccharide deacetylase family protein [Planctomycetota bacterium]